MHKFTYSMVIMMGVSAAGVWCLQLAGSRAQPPRSLPPPASSDLAPPIAPSKHGAAMVLGGEGYLGGGSSNAAAHAFSLVKSDGSIENYTATRLYVYQLSPGAAKPKRIDLNNAPSLAGYGGDYGGSYGGGYSGGMMDGDMVASGSGRGGMGDMGGGMGSAATRATAGHAGGEAGPTWVWAYVFDEPVDPTAQQGFKPVRAEVKVVVPAASNTVAEAGGMSGSGGFSGMGMDSMGMSSTPVPTVQLLEDPPPAKAGSPAPWLGLTLPKGSKVELKNIALLVRLDIWIRDAHTQLKAKRSQADDFTALEKHVKALLDEDYEAQLVKQRNDVAKLREKLDRLQADLERRAQAKERVVSVQLGQLVLDAQGLLNQ